MWIGGSTQISTKACVQGVESMHFVVSIVIAIEDFFLEIYQVYVEAGKY